MQPFLKWAGGKRWLFSTSFTKQIPTFDDYIEPFLGGAAAFFSLLPARARLSDTNPELINLYCVIRDSPDEIGLLLRKHHTLHSKEHYYSIRSSIPLDRTERAARVLYLNRTCWNGLYRTNQKGEFNVPIGTKTEVYKEAEDLREYANVLRSATITCNDFEESIERAESGTLIFADPPYTVKHNNNGFIKYNENIFSWNDQIRLRNSLERAVSRGASVLLTNADHESVSSLYAGFGNHTRISRASVISGNNSGRSSTTELMVIA